MNLQDKILKAIKEGLNTAFNFDDIANTRLDDIKTEPTKNSAYSVKHKWLYPKLAQLVNDVLKEKELALTIDEQNTLFENCIKCSIYYLFTDNDTFKAFIQKYCDIINLKANLNWIDTSNITDMSNLFLNSEFNGDISSWDVSIVTNMCAMFLNSQFNGDISQWDVSNVNTMAYLFHNSQFNRDISRWDVSNVNTMAAMFYNSQFNGDISNWDVSSVNNMYSMFAYSQFTGNISQWDVSNVTDMSDMFAYSQFTGNISKWDMSNVTLIKNMFYKCPIKPKFIPKKIK